jgi:ABC-type multidrug transport system permease subunit
MSEPVASESTATTPAMASSEERFHPLLELTKARLREFFREPSMIFWVFGFPILMAIGLGLAFRSQPPEKPVVAVLASEDSARARALLASDAVAAVRLSDGDALRGLARTKYALVVDLREAEPVYRYDLKSSSARLARALSDAEIQRAAGRRDPLSPRDEAQTLPGTRYIDFLLPGLIGMNVMGSSVWGVGYSLVVARKRKLLRRFAVTAMRRSHYLLSYFFSRLLFLVLELGVLVAFGALAFGTIIQGSVLGLVLGALLGAAAFAGLGLLVGARLDNTEAANGWMNFIQLPMFVLSGAYFSNERFPEWMQPIIQALPLTALVDSLRLTYNEGATLTRLAPELLILVAWATVTFFLAARSFRWT